MAGGGGGRRQGHDFLHALAAEDDRQLLLVQAATPAARAGQAKMDIHEDVLTVEHAKAVPVQNAIV